MERRLQYLEPRYCYGGDVSDLSLTSVVAPSQSGKSTLIGDAIELAPSLGFNTPDGLLAEVDTITTRPHRKDDPRGYRTAAQGITHAWMMGKISRNELIQWALYENGDIYATDRQSYKGRFNMLPTQEKALRMLAQAGFHHLNIVCVVRPADEWRACFPEVITTKNHLGRIQEAVKSLEFGMNTPGVIRIVNFSDPERRRQTAEALVRIATSDHETYTSDILDPIHDLEYGRHNLAMQNAAREMIENARITA